MYVGLKHTHTHTQRERERESTMKTWDDAAKTQYWLGRDAWSREQYRLGRRCIFGLRHLVDVAPWDIYYAALADASSYSPYYLEGMRSAAHATDLKGE